MGVRGLQTFMEYCCSKNVACHVNIKDLVENYRKETDREVIIVVDGSSCLRPLYGQLDWICGGQIKEFVQQYQTFIQAFQEIGVKLVFFFDGPTQPEKRKVWVERRLRNLEDANTVFDQVRKGKHLSQFGGQNQRQNQRQNQILLPPAISYVASYAIMVSTNCEIHRTVKECDQEIAEYAMSHSCFAILGQDSDYVIYDGPKYYLSILHLNVEKMTTVNYNRWALARQLHIGPSLLPLLASLVGNDIVRPDDLLPFHRRICKPNKNPRARNKSQGRPSPKDVIYNVANYIRGTDDRYLDEAIPVIARRVFGNDQRTSQLRLSVRSYSINAHSVSQPKRSDFAEQSDDAQNCWRKIQKHAEMRFTNGKLDSMVFAIMHDLPYESATGLEDFEQKDLPPSAAVYQPLRQHIYGIILHEKPGGAECHIVEEWCMTGKTSLDEPARVPVISPSSDHPGLMTLWNESDTSAELLSKKWALLAEAVSSNLDPDRLKAIPTIFLAPTLLLYFLINQVPSQFLTTWEVEAFIATAVMLPSLSTASLSVIQVDKVHPRAIQLACIFSRGASIIKMLTDACGNPVPPQDVSTWHYFDGKLFQTIYQKAQSGKTAVDLCNHQVSELEQFNLIRSIVLPSQE